MRVCRRELRRELLTDVRVKGDKVSGHNTTSGLESRLKACCNLAVGTISALWDLCQLGNDLFVWKLFARTAECLDEP